MEMVLIRWVVRSNVLHAILVSRAKRKQKAHGSAILDTTVKKTRPRVVCVKLVISARIPQVTTE